MAKPEEISWSEWTRGMERYLRLKTFPVGLKMPEHTEQMDENPWVRKSPEKLTLCQMISIVRTFDWTVGGTADDLVPPSCATVLGLAEVPDFVADGTVRSVVWLEKKEDAAACERFNASPQAGTRRFCLLRQPTIRSFPISCSFTRMPRRCRS